jgi:hypothetical protein
MLKQFYICKSSPSALLIDSWLQLTLYTSAAGSLSLAAL